MTEMLMLATGSTCLSIGVFLCLWQRVRVLRVQNDLLELRVNALEQYKDGQLEPSDAAAVGEIIAGMVDAADLITLSYFVERVTATNSEGGAEVSIPSSNAAKRILYRFSIRMTRYVCFETFSGMLLTAIWIVLIGWRELKALTFDKHDAWVRRPFTSASTSALAH